MTNNDTMAIAIAAVNRWMFHGWNYDMVDKTYDLCGESKQCYVPRFLAEVKWTCNFQHMLEKWRKATDDNNIDSRMTRFYANLDCDNRQLLIEWVMLNYKDERTIIDKSILDK